MCDCDCCWMHHPLDGPIRHEAEMRRQREEEAIAETNRWVEEHADELARLALTGRTVQEVSDGSQRC